MRTSPWTSGARACVAMAYSFLVVKPSASHSGGMLTSRPRRDRTGRRGTPRPLVVLAERIALPVLGAEDPREVGCPSKTHPHEVEALALVPVGGRPDVHERGEIRLVPGELDLEDERVIVLDRVEVVDDLDHGRLGRRVVDGGDEREELEPELGVVSQESRHRGQGGGLHDDPGVSLRLVHGLDRVPVLLFEERDHFLELHAKPSLIFFRATTCDRTATQRGRALFDEGQISGGSPTGPALRVRPRAREPRRAHGLRPAAPTGGGGATETTGPRSSLAWSDRPTGASRGG